MRQVNALHAAGRMFEERDHVHTLLYDFRWEYRRDPDGVPVELALDHPYRGFVPVFIDRAEDVTERSVVGVVADGASSRPPPRIRRRPGRRLHADRTRGRRRGRCTTRGASDDRRTLLLWFLSTPPEVAWEPVVAEHRRRLEESGLGTVVAALPFIPTIPGTDIYTDKLWLD